MWRDRTLTFVNASVIAPTEEVFSSVRLRRGRIDGLGVAPDRRDVVIDLEESVVLPGLVNAHDHLELNSLCRMKWRDTYSNVREWIADFQPRFATDARLATATARTLGDRLWVGALKNLLSGVTTVCHHNPIHRALNRGYPIRVVRRFGFSHSLGIDGTSIADVHRRTPAAWPWIVHAAEGVDSEAAVEIDILDRLGCLSAKTVIVHGVALEARSAQRLLDCGGSLVWCPTSNQFLFGKTADVRSFDDAGRLALGSDSRLSGEGDLLDELRAADATHQVTPRSLLHAVTDAAASVLRLGDTGALRVGVPADLTVIRRITRDPLKALVSARRTDIRLTMVGGRPLVCDPQLSAVFDGPREARQVRVDGAAKLLARSIADRAATLREIEPGLEVLPC